jgi:hypothetical protein
VIDKDIEQIITVTLFFLAMAIALFYWAVSYNIIAVRKFSRRNTIRVVVNFNQNSFCSLEYFNQPVFQAYKDAGYSMASVSTSKKISITYSLFYFKRNLGVPGGLVNNCPDNVYTLHADRNKFGINHYGSNKIKKIESSLIKEIFLGRDVFVEVSSVGVIFGFRSVASEAEDIESMYSQCNELMWKFATLENAA